MSGAPDGLGSGRRREPRLLELPVRGLHERRQLGRRQVVEVPARPALHGGAHLGLIEALRDAELDQPRAQGPRCGFVRGR